MIAAAVTLGLFWLILALVVDVMWRDGAKVLAALEGRSWTASPTHGRPVTIRFSRAGWVSKATPMTPALRAAA